MSSLFFERLHPAQISPDVITLIEESKAWDDSDTTTDEVFQLIVEGLAQLWYFEHGFDRGIMITQVCQEEEGCHVFIWRFLGKGFLPVYDFIEEKLMDFARTQGAESIRTETHQKGEEILCAHGFHKTDEVLIKEVDNGRPN